VFPAFKRPFEYRRSRFAGKGKASCGSLFAMCEKKKLKRRHMSSRPEPVVGAAGLTAVADTQYRRRQVRAAVEAAEQVRAQARPAKQNDAERARRYRARKRDGRGAASWPVPLTSLSTRMVSVSMPPNTGNCASSPASPIAHLWRLDS
jgi:hypothetical protein